MRILQRRLIALAAALTLLPLAAQAQQAAASVAAPSSTSASTVPGAGRDMQRVDQANRVLKEIMMAPDSGIPQSLMQDAHAIAVIPGVIKAGFILGGRYGEGLVAIKTPQGTWSNPAFVSITGASLGFQAGVSSTDIILVFRSERGVDRLVHGEFTLGADLGVAAGPVGRYANASTNGELSAEIYSYSRSRGLFAGVALDGARIGIDDSADQRVYGKDITARRIFEGQVNPVPQPVVDFRDRLEEYTQK